MERDIALDLLAINHQFYQTFALQFSATRQRLQPGVTRILETIPVSAQLLDLGCGNGELALTLAWRGHQGLYIGLDFSAQMLTEAGYRLTNISPGQFLFMETDISKPAWEEPLYDYRFDLVLAFAILHHIPGQELRRQILSKVRRLLKPEGKFVFSVWQFLGSPRLAQRIQSWEKVDLTAEAVDPGDYLLDWRHGGSGLRYVHHFTAEELENLAIETGFTLLDTFYSDGEGGKLGLYQSWRAS
jgi:SAM-dependent methyltransferase